MLIIYLLNWIWDLLMYKKISEIFYLIREMGLKERKTRRWHNIILMFFYSKSIFLIHSQR